MTQDTPHLDTSDTPATQQPYGSVLMSRDNPLAGIVDGRETLHLDKAQFNQLACLTEYGSHLAGMLPDAGLLKRSYPYYQHNGSDLSSPNSSRLGGYPYYPGYSQSMSALQGGIHPVGRRSYSAEQTLADATDIAADNNLATRFIDAPRNTPTYIRATVAAIFEAAQNRRDQSINPHDGPTRNISLLSPMRWENYPGAGAQIIASHVPAHSPIAIDAMMDRLNQDIERMADTAHAQVKRGFSPHRQTNTP